MSEIFSQHPFNICIVGAGVIGLTTASILKEALPNSQITIFADKFLSETTSDGAAGIFRPSHTFQGPTPEVTKKWLLDSFEFYDNLLHSFTPAEAEKIGLIRRRFVAATNKSIDFIHNEFLAEAAPDYRTLTESELRAYLEEEVPGYQFGVTCTTLVTECKKYLPYLAKRFKENGGTFVRKRLEGFEDVSDDFDLVINCTGLGAQQLCNDTKLCPVRGQVFKVKAPWVKHALYVESDTYIIPGCDGMVTLGGVRQFESSNLEVDPYDSAAIWERCTNAMPSLKKANVEREWVGLRPYRTEVRVEDELVKLRNGKLLKVVHNYGHGGYGVLSAPGTSKHAVSLAVKLFTENKSKL